MKKPERLNDMLIYVNKKRTFNLKDLMERYQISKSTALRDLASLENIGLPLYSELGRNGQYHIVNNHFLSPILFTLDEISSLYFAMLTLENYNMCPFNIDLHKLKEKFEESIPDKQLQKIREIETILQPEVKQSLDNDILREILDILLTKPSKTYLIESKNGGRSSIYKVNFLKVFTRHGYWYTEVFNLEKQVVESLNCQEIKLLSD